MNYIVFDPTETNGCPVAIVRTIADAYRVIDRLPQYDFVHVSKWNYGQPQA